MRRIEKLIDLSDVCSATRKHAHATKNKSLWRFGEGESIVWRIYVYVYIYIYIYLKKSYFRAGPCRWPTRQPITFSSIVLYSGPTLK